MKTLKFNTITEIKEANKALGHYFFSKGANRFFKSKNESAVLKGRFFITSEISPSNEKKYSLRMAMDNGSIETIGEFHSFRSKQAAKNFLNELPDYFYEAYELAVNSFNSGNHNEFKKHLIGESDKTTFRGACNWIVENREQIDSSFLKFYYEG